MLIKPPLDFWPFNVTMAPFTKSKQRMIKLLLKYDMTQWAAAKRLLKLVVIVVLLYVAVKRRLYGRQ